VGDLIQMSRETCKIIIYMYSIFYSFFFIKSSKKRDLQLQQTTQLSNQELNQS